MKVPRSWGTGHANKPSGILSSAPLSVNGAGERIWARSGGSEPDRVCAGADRAWSDGVSQGGRGNRRLRRGTREEVGVNRFMGPAPGAGFGERALGWWAPGAGFTTGSGG